MLPKIWVILIIIQAHAGPALGAVCDVSKDDFDINAVMALIHDNKVTNADALEQEINKTPAINKVDIDHDGLVDYIQIRERHSGSDVVFDFYAIPSSTGNEKDACLVASLNLSAHTAGWAQLEGSYPVYACDIEPCFYYAYIPYWPFHYGLFCDWAFFPGRALYWHHFHPSLWHWRHMTRLHRGFDGHHYHFHSGWHVHGSVHGLGHGFEHGFGGHHFGGFGFHHGMR